MALLIPRLQALFCSLFLITALFSFCVSTAAASVIQTTTSSQSKPSKLCKNPIVRKEWRTLSKSTQKGYLKAVQCLLTKPAITPKSVAPGAVGRYDGFIATRIIQTYSIHFVGHFLPWHRYYTAIYEKALREECGYNGAQPYWDWTLDVSPFGKFTESPIWDPPLHRDPRRSQTLRRPRPHWWRLRHHRTLHRQHHRQHGAHDGPVSGLNTTKWTLAKKDFGTFVRAVEGGPSYDASGVHGGGHFSVGGFLGEMGDLYNSPADPVFYLHHTNLDRVWWSWQKKDLARRLTDISGPINYMDYDNLQGGNVTLDFPLYLGVNAPNVTVGDTMDIRGEVLCYEYDKVYEF